MLCLFQPLEAVDGRSVIYSIRDRRTTSDRAFFMVWMSVDKWIRCGLPRGLDKRIEDSSRQERAARDESGEVPARRRAGLEYLGGLVGRVDTSCGDDLDAVAEPLTQPTHILERAAQSP